MNSIPTGAGRTCVIGGNGYIGQALYNHIKGDIIDIQFPETWRNKFWDVDRYDTIILLAGHSSMPLGRDDPDGAWQNNVVNFKRLLDELRPDQRLIYMSSASIYNGIKAKPDEECIEFKPTNMYDLSKYIIDQLALQSGKHTYGLRLCTVNGFSPCLRVDLMINKMVESVKANGKIIIKNAQLERPITGMQDVCRAIKAIYDSKEDNRGIYNLCSLHGFSVLDYANAVVAEFGGTIEDLGTEPHYVYGADTTKFEKTFNFEFRETLDTIIRSLKEEPDEKVIRTINDSSNYRLS